MARFTQKERETSAASTSSSSTGSMIVVHQSSESGTPSTRPTSITSSSNAGNLEEKIESEHLARHPTRISSVQVATIEPNLTAATPIEYPASRAVSGQTFPPVDIVETESMTRGLLDETSKTLSTTSTSRGDGQHGRRSARLSTATSTLVSAASSLGKRGRDTVESGKDKLRSLKRGDKRKSLRPRGADGSALIPEDDLSESPRKKTRLSVTTEKEQQKEEEAKTKRPAKPIPKKKWLAAGLYVGQHQNFDARLTESKNKIKQSSKHNTAAPNERKILPLPMFIGARLLEVGRDFKLPFDVFSPLPHGQPKPDEWRKTQSNKFTADAASEWKQNKPLPLSRCLCTPEGGCGDECQNRYMLYECDATNCSIGPDHCTNRQFAELKERVKSGKKYNIGVEVMKTMDKGFGVRACRTFRPYQIIVEYAGEVITQEECDRRMKHEYKDAEAYYLMNFDQNMIIDATRGSIARFVNHSCEPNCNMVKWIVSGKPRMALFAGDQGVMTGEELTYDYCQTENFLWGKECRCGAPTCRGTLGATPAKESPSKGQKGVAGAKRKFNALLETSKETVKRRPSVLKKKRRITYDAVPAERPAMGSQRRMTSSSTEHTTLIGRQDAVSKGTKKSGTIVHRRVAGRASSSPRNARRSKVRNVLNRATSGIKRRAGTVASRSALNRQSGRQSVERGKSDGAFEALMADEGKENDATGGKEVGPGSKSLKRLATNSTFRKGVVNTVNGSRRAAAMAKLGVRGNDGLGKSMRIISQDLNE